MKATRKIIEIDEERCDGCGNCVISCAEGAIEIIDGKARLVKDSYCDGLGACLGECPQGALRIIEREADEFDPEAVEEYLKHKEETKGEAPAEIPTGCPSGRVRTLLPQAGHGPATPHVGRTASALSHWPVQLKLVPPDAPFLRGSHLLVAADCTVLAHPDFHREFLRGKSVVLGCPKLDNADEYVKKFTEMFKTSGIKNITVVEMEVPCCSAMGAIVKRAMQAAGKEIPLEEVVVGVGGQILRRKGAAA